MIFPEPDPKSIDALSTMGGIATLGAISRTVLTEDRRSFIGFTRGLACAVFVTFIVSGFIDDYHFSDGTHNMIVGVSAFLADDILLLTINLMKLVMANPAGALDWVINFLSGLRGGKK